MASTMRLDEQRLVDAMRARGGAMSVGELERRVGAHRNTVRRHLRALVAAGLVDERARGKYELARRQLGLGREAKRLIEVLETAGLAAHLTGFDLLVPHAHQHVFEFPHLVYAEPMALESTEFELAANDYVVQRADGGQRVSAPDRSKLVVLRKQPDPERYRVHGFVAPVEKAWVDALREAHRKTVPLEFIELGRILRSLVDADADIRFLRHYARQIGYLNRIDAAMNGADTDDPAALQALRAGYEA